MHLTGQLPRQCEVHMNSYQQVYGMNAAGLEGAAGNGGSNQNLKFRSSSHQLLQQAKVTVPQAILQVLFYCCRANGLLAKFPSRAKRIDVLSRFIFPLIFAIFNLAYWLYYLLAKNNFSGNSNLAWCSNRARNPLVLKKNNEYCFPQLIVKLYLNDKL